MFVHATDKIINQKRIFKALNGDIIKSTDIFNDQYNMVHVWFTKDNHRCDYLLQVKKIKGIKKPCLYITYKNNDYILMK